MKNVFISFVLIFLLSCHNCKTNNENKTNHHSYKKYVDQNGALHYESKSEYVDDNGVHHLQNKSKYYKESSEYNGNGEKHNKRTYESETKTEHYEFKK